MQRQERRFDKQMPYLEYMASDMTHEDVHDVVIFLHGKGERGDDLSLVERHGLPKEALSNDFEIEMVPVAIIAPQLQSNQSGWSGKRLEDFTLHLYERFPNVDRIHITGLSLGGIGVGNALFTTPNLYYSYGIVAGFPGNYKTSEDAETAAGKHIRMWHGSADTVVGFNSAVSKSGRANAFNGELTFPIRVFEGKGHSIWGNVYSGGMDSEYWKWLESTVNPDAAPLCEGVYEEGYRVGKLELSNAISSLLEVNNNAQSRSN